MFCDFGTIQGSRSKRPDAGYCWLCTHVAKHFVNDTHVAGISVTISVWCLLYPAHRPIAFASFLLCVRLDFLSLYLFQRPSMEFENATRGESALFVSPWGSKAQIKLLPGQSLPMMLRGPRRFSFLELRFQIPISLLVLAPIVHGALNDDFKLRNEHL